MNYKQQKMRYIIKRNGKYLMQIESINSISRNLPFTKQHYYKRQIDGKMTYKGDTYELIDVVTTFHNLHPNYFEKIT